MLDAITSVGQPNDYKSFSVQMDEIAIRFQKEHVELQSDFKIQPNYCVTFAEKQISYCIGIVDMVNSTKIAAKLGMKKMSVYYQYFLNLMSKVVIEFDGQIIKNIGDCLLFYFPKTEMLSDLSVLRRCLDCSLAMVQVRDFLCLQMKKADLPNISYRVSMDYGSVIPMRSSDASSQDMIGPAINMCSKINRCAEENSIVVGGDLYQIAKHLDGFTFKEVKSCPVGFKNDYPVYKIMRQSRNEHT
jgi:adenylate cyclase